ncbi:MAG: lytic transglycosylase domain-containing protein [Acidimicrobiales bacterium]
MASGTTGTRTYVVIAGDNLSLISARFGVSVAALAAANGIPDPNLVDAGATLVIPFPGGGATAPTSAPTGSYPPELAYYPDRLALVPTFEQAAAAAGVPVTLLEGLTWQESGWQAEVVSPAGAIGVGQLTPATVAFVRAVLDPSALDPWVATDNIVISAQFLGYLLNQTGGNEQLAVAAYYQGLGAVQDYGILPVSRSYVADVLALQAEF